MRLWSWRDGFVIAVIAGIFVFLIVVSCGAIYAYEEPKWQKVTGTVQHTGTALMRGMQLTIIKLDDGITYTCTDPRCSLLLPSERVELWCYRASEKPAPSSWTCKFGQSEDTVTYPTTDR